MKNKPNQIPTINTQLAKRVMEKQIRQVAQNNQNQFDFRILNMIGTIVSD
jgi:hypothetical protein